MIKMIAAVAKNGVIGKNNDLPWAGKYKEDMQFFRKTTANSTVIMGRATFESMGSKPLPKRNNIVVTRSVIENIYCSATVKDAINAALEFKQDIWLIGGSSIYREGLQFADEIYLTLIPETVEGEGLIHFPWISPADFKVSELIQLENSELKVAKYTRV